mgnify:CR=1 FL=1
MLLALFVVFFFQAEDGIRDLVRSRGLGDVYKRQVISSLPNVVSRQWLSRVPEPPLFSTGTPEALVPKMLL